MTGHVPVLLAETIALLGIRDGGIYCDGTFGGGGHTAAMLEAAHCTVVAIDRDPEAIARGATLLARYPDRLRLIEGRFGALESLLAAAGVATIDGVLLDLGVSSFQLDAADRGFSFRFTGPLDMRMEKTGTTAAELVNSATDSELRAILRELGEERHASRIARAIVAARAEAPIETTERLAEIIRAAAPRDPSGLDTATRSFQALRMAVNDELGEIDRGLEAGLRVLAPGGRLVVIAFHSLEDRPVKRCFAAASGRAGTPSRHDPGALARMAAPPPFRLLTTRAVRPSDAEIAHNPRARSARLRAVERLEAA